MVRYMKRHTIANVPIEVATDPLLSWRARAKEVGRRPKERQTADDTRMRTVAAKRGVGD